MKQSRDTSRMPAAPAPLHWSGDPARLVCLALVLASLTVLLRIASIW